MTYGGPVKVTVESIALPTLELRDAQACTPIAPDEKRCGYGNFGAGIAQKFVIAPPQPHPPK